MVSTKSLPDISVNAIKSRPQTIQSTHTLIESEAVQSLNDVEDVTFNWLETTDYGIRE